ncbi:zinc finger, CCHC-type containing protein, partial [Tanacetum coccineum]
GDDATVEQLRKRAKWDNDDYDSLEAKYMAEDASNKKFLVSNFSNYKMTDSRPVIEQYNKLLGILGRFTQHKMNMDEAVQVSCIINKLPSSWKDFKHTLKHVELGSHMRIEESLKVQDNDKLKSNNVAGPSVVNMVKHNNSSKYNDNKGKRKHHDNTKVDPNKKAKPTCWKCGKTGHIKRDYKGVNVGNKANGLGTKGSMRLQKDKKGLGFTVDKASTSRVKIGKMSQESSKMPSVDPAHPVPSEKVCLKVKLEPDEWIKDSGCTRHMMGNKDFLSTYESIDGGYSRLGNQAYTPRTLRSPSKPDRVHICIISGAIRETCNK